MSYFKDGLTKRPEGLEEDKSSNTKVCLQCEEGFIFIMIKAELP